MQISFLVSSDICSRLLGKFIPNWCCHGSSLYLLPPYRKHAKVSGEGAPQASETISNAEIEAAKQEWADLVLSDDEYSIL